MRCLIVLCLLLVSSCASLKEKRPKPEKIETCEELSLNILQRDLLFKSLRGQIHIKSKDLSAQIQIALRSPYELRAEFKGALGVTLALLQINSRWVMFYVPRQQKVYRLPMEEMYKNTLRRQQFLEMLPVPIQPETLFVGLLTQVTDGNGLKLLSPCFYDSKENVYVIHFSIDHKITRVLWVDPTSYAPRKVLEYDRSFKTLEEQLKRRPLQELNYEKFEGNSYATLPRKIKVTRDAKLLQSIEWTEAERWDDLPPKAFQWQPNASIVVQDF